MWTLASLVGPGPTWNARCSLPHAVTVTERSPALTCSGITKYLSATHFGYQGPILGIPPTLATTWLNLVSDRYSASRIGCETVNAKDIRTAPAARSAKGRLLVFAISFQPGTLAATSIEDAAEVTANQRHGN